MPTFAVTRHHADVQWVLRGPAAGGAVDLDPSDPSDLAALKRLETALAAPASLPVQEFNHAARRYAKGLAAAVHARRGLATTPQRAHDHGRLRRHRTRLG